MFKKVTDKEGYRGTVLVNISGIDNPSRSADKVTDREVCRAAVVEIQGSSESTERVTDNEVYRGPIVTTDSKI